jgi:hypothetical protein
MGLRVWQSLAHGGSTTLDVLFFSIVPPSFGGKGSRLSVVSLLTMSMRVLCAILPLMVASMARRSAGVQLVFSSSLELAVYISNLFSNVLEGIIFPRPVVGNFLAFGKYDCKGAFIFDFGWMWMVIQSNASLAPPQHTPFAKWRGGIHCGRQKGCRRCVGTS